QHPISSLLPYTTLFRSRNFEREKAVERLAIGHERVAGDVLSSALLFDSCGVVGGEAFVEPEIVPLRACHQIAEPRVRQLVGDKRSEEHTSELQSPDHLV